jgi:hypothetical protein
MKIDHPQVYLYSYQLSRESATDPNSIWTWVDKLWQKFNVNNNFPNDFSQANCQQLLLSKAQKFDFSPSLNGSLRCCRLHDGEGILARVGSPENDDNRDLSLEIFKTFNPDRVLVPINDSQWLGQTILITYKLETQATPTQKLADEIVQNLLGDKPSATPRSTQLFGSPIFEYSSLDSQQQIFVYVLDDQSEKNLQQTLQSVFEIFYYRHKIVKAFRDSREAYQLAQGFYKIVEQDIKNLQQKTNHAGEEKLLDLRAFKEDIKTLLKDSLRHQATLQKLEDFDNTIAINVYNYQQKLLEISDRCHLLPEELTTFSFFADKTAPHCQRQIQGDLGYFKHGTDLINTAIASIRGIVEIEQAEIDRELQNTIQSVGTGIGVGVGVGGIVATSYPLINKENPLQFPSAQLPPHPIIIAIALSLLSGGGLGFLAWNFTRKRLKSAPTRNLELNPVDQKSDRSPT